MDPINPWLDPAEVRRLAEKLMIPLREPSITVSDPGFDGDFVGYDAVAIARPAPAAVQPAPPAPVPEPAVFPNPSPFQAAPPDPEEEPNFPQEPIEEPTEQEEPESPEPAPEPPPLPPRPSAPPANNPERGPFLERVKRFRNWMHEQFSATGIFILDREGSVIFDESGHGRLHFMARSLALASRRPGSPGGNVHVKVGAGATFEVIPVETAYGYLVLGAVVPAPLPPASVNAVMEALAMTVSPPGGDSSGSA